MFIPIDVKSILDKLDKHLTISKASEGTVGYLAYYFQQSGKDVIVLFPDESYLRSFSSILSILSPRNFPFWENSYIEFGPYAPSENSKKAWADRWAALFQLKEAKGPKIVACTVDNLLPFWPPQTILDHYYYFISINDEIPYEEFLKEITEWGYERTKLVTNIGEVSVRGDIIDIYPPGYNFPIRIELFSDIVESIRTYDPVTQRSQNNINEAIILPISPTILNEKLFSDAESMWEYLWKIGSLSKDTIAYFQNSILTASLNIPPGLFYRESVPFISHISRDSIFFLVEPEILRRSLEDLEAEWKNYFEMLKLDKGISIPYDRAFHTPQQAKALWLDKTTIIFDSLAKGGKNSLELPEQKYYSFSDLFWKPEEKRRPLSTLLTNLESWKKIKNQTILAFRSQNSRKKFLKLVKELTQDSLEIKRDFHPHKKGIYAVVSNLKNGLSLDWNHLLFLPEAIILPAQDKKIKKSRKDFKGIKGLDEIRVGDFLVHRDYGIGIFKGLTRLQVGDVGNDFLEIEYADSNKLFLPVDKLGLIQKYKGPDGIVPKLDKLGSATWIKNREKVKRAIEAIAHDLVSMYAYRKVAKRFKYPPIDEEFREFEATFPFEETPDQERAIEEVLKDMEKEEPMDRLICGDVGFGKTEIAMRAAYRAVLAGRQVALLCPTTVLAEQHFRTFKSRMEDFGVKVAMLSRFVPRQRQKEIIESIKRGEIDIIIGTHRLLSSDVTIPKIGLLILDEEQRFGVRQKEKLKQMRKNIDVLTLTATPIPRTLQLSLAGIRDLSVIETPPVDRKPVETNIIERDKEKLREIVLRELHRGGQVFWVYNRVRGIENVKQFVKSICPDARVEVAHGQMSERRLEETLHNFLLGEIDILVCTAIIEAGLDFPRANTLIVDTPQLFGLGQLYQLRGRVGRSSTQAYAYFVVDSLKKLSKSVLKRLKTILELDYLGAGFKVAMEDLKLRGAGNLLGEAQTGNIAKVGLDLYLEMLDKEVRRLKGEKIDEEIEPQLNIFVEANIPTSYIMDNEERLTYYKLLSTCRTREEFKMVEQELQDRFGHLPKSVANLISILEFKSIIKKLQADRADFYKDKVVIGWEKTQISVAPERMVSWINNQKGSIRMINSNKIELLIFDEDYSKEVSQWTEKLSTILSEEQVYEN